MSDDDEGIRLALTVQGEQIAALEADLRELRDLALGMARAVMEFIGPLPARRALAVIEGEGRGRSKRRARLELIQGESDREHWKRLAGGQRP